MKVIMILIVLAIAVVVGLYYVGGVSTLDPAQQATEFYNSLQTGMSWEQVVAMKAPKKFFLPNPDAMGGRTQPQEYNEQVIREAIQNDTVPGGFMFDYMFTGDHAWTLNFDSQGRLTGTEPILTTKQLFEGKAFQQ
ncbi:MAG: hypothetical protein IT445_15845 [Phycisphaeraceae bacterium]|nr:hypothetical protein [Phycisphaeraceae bacterium]